LVCKGIAFGMIVSTGKEKFIFVRILWKERKNIICLLIIGNSFGLPCKNPKKAYRNDFIDIGAKVIVAKKVETGTSATRMRKTLTSLRTKMILNERKNQ